MCCNLLLCSLCILDRIKMSMADKYQKQKKIQQHMTDTLWDHKRHN